MSSKRPRGGKQPKNYKENDSDDSDDDFELPLKKMTSPKSNSNKKKKDNSSTSKKEDTQKAKKNKKNKENMPNNKKEAPWVNRQPLHPKNNHINYSSCHLLHFLRNRSFGTTPPFWQDQSLNKPLMNVNQKLQVYKTYMEFDRRITALEWHPKYKNIVAVAAKSGDTVLWDFENEKNLSFFKGTGANGSIQAMKFDYTNNSILYTVSVNGTVARHDLTDVSEEERYLETHDLNHWYTSMDLIDRHTFMVGDNKGTASVLTNDGTVLWSKKLHKKKITHLECCPSNSNYIVSASVDSTMKVWDIRRMKSQEDCIYALQHEAPVNSAYFSSSGNCVLTTDQKMELRVYAGSSFSLMQIIRHPHRHFQHLTPIKATWHPLRDIIVVGRYPDPAFPTYTKEELRSIDFFDAASGKLLHQHVTRDLDNKIVSLNLFNNTGDQMLSAAGMCGLLWRPKFPSNDKSTKSTKDDDDDDDDDSDDGNSKGKKGGKNKKNLKRKKNDSKVEQTKLKAMKS